jgi:hypothetical protein
MTVSRLPPPKRPPPPPEEIERALMCSANGCPNRWCVDGGHGRLCSAHAWSDTQLWARITEEQREAETDRAVASTAPPRAPSYRLPKSEKTAILLGLRDALRGIGQGARDWAYRLQSRETAGLRLTPAQREICQGALRGDRGPGGHDAV